MHKNNGETVSTSSHETTANVDNTSIKHVQRILATNPDNTETVLYNIEGQKVGDRALGKNTSWYSDQELTLNEKLYYRVSTNEWVDSNDVYSYESKNIVVKTQSSAQLLYTANGKKITNRELAPNTAWKADRLAYINDKSYYRVATNEFVPISDMIVK
ncbi:SLAP domain-containing protein [Companilactobacillus musae]|uniref:SLAP domain-containing protein n=1 Tax=Companilactobacillus musae TaxID=1903258 RepID=UPI000E651C38|nr:SLAP domain-containing protein [Companilactobacillus musae]